MTEVIIAEFTPTFDFSHFEARHRNFNERIMRGEISIDDAVIGACSSTYDPTTIYNALLPHLAERSADNKILALRASAYVLGGITGFVAPYLFTDNPHGLVVCGSGVIGALVLGPLTVAFTDASHNTLQKYNLAYNHISAVVAALEREYDMRKPLAEELVPGEGDGSYKVLQSRDIVEGTVKKTVRYSLNNSRHSFDLLIMNGAPEKIRIGNLWMKKLEQYDPKTALRFDSWFVDPISFSQASVERYQEAIRQYGRLTLWRA